MNFNETHKKSFPRVEFNVTEFDVEDVITTSGTNLDKYENQLLDLEDLGLVH